MVAGADGRIILNGDYRDLTFVADRGSISTQAVLFTDSPETVKFNALKEPQKTAIMGGAQYYDAKGGADDVTLPDVNALLRQQGLAN